jgi:hypothetical protein
MSLLRPTVCINGVDVVFYSRVHGATAALPYLKRTDGALVCVGSALSDLGVPLQTAYCAAKHAIKGWLDGLRVELWKEGSKVRVTLVKPSRINTPLFNKAKTQMGVMPMPIPPISEPVLPAEGILRGAEGDERDVFIGGAGKALSVAERINSNLLDLQQLCQGFRGRKLTGRSRPTRPATCVPDRVPGAAAALPRLARTVLAAAHGQGAPGSRARRVRRRVRMELSTVGDANR